MARELHPDDLKHLADLFNIHREATAHGGYLKPIADEAMKHLRDFAESLTEKPEPTTEEVVKGDLDANATVEGEQEQRQAEGATETHFQEDLPSTTRSR